MRADWIRWSVVAKTARIHFPKRCLPLLVTRLLSSVEGTRLVCRPFGHALIAQSLAGMNLISGRHFSK